MRVHLLTDDGVDKFRSHLEDARKLGTWGFPDEEIYDPLYSSLPEFDVDVDVRDFMNRFELAEYLFQKLDPVLDSMNQESLARLWNWLALFYFKSICKCKDGRYVPGENARWLQSNDYTRYYRHFISGPVNIYKQYRDNPKIALPVLLTRPGEPGEAVEQLTSTYDIIANQNLMIAAGTLYLEDATKLKKGSSSKSGGGARRFRDIVGQFELTWDLYSLQAENFINMLPNEFDRFKKIPEVPIEIPNVDF